MATVGLLAIGASGAAAAVMGALWGKGFVAGDPSGVTYTPARCADLFEYVPHATSCEAAATSHHFDEIVGYRLATGALGLGLLGVVVVARRRRRRATGMRASAGPRMLPPAVAPTVGLSLFGVAAALLGLDGANRLVQGVSHGGGGQLSGALVSVAVAGWFGRRLLTTLEAAPPQLPS